jgi:hypothetical protein
VRTTEQTARIRSPRTGLGVRSVVPGASLASAGPSAARTQGAVLGGAKDKPAKCPEWGKDAAARSVSAAARGVRGATGRMLATLRALLHTQGTGAPSRLALAFALSLSALAFTAAPALAAAPETPQVTAPCEECVSATEAPVEGTLNPAKEGEPGETYEFVYRQSATECKGAGEVATLPGTSLGAEKEAVSTRLEGLTPGTVYTFCLVAHNAAATETSVSLAVSFTTAVPPEPPETLPATDITITGATFHAALDPEHAAEGIRYKFFYQASATECRGEGEISIPPSAVPVAGARGEAVEQPVSGLLPSTTYTYCAFVRNAPAETALGAPVTFTTPEVAPPAISNESTPSIGTSSAEVSAFIAPGNLSSAYHVEYVAQAQFESTGWANAARVPAADAALPAAVRPVAVREQLLQLLPATQYRFRFVATNAAGGGPGSEQTFTTRGASAVGAGALPDERRYELASGESSGNTYVPPGRVSTIEPTDPFSLYPMRSSQDGNSVTYVGDPSDENGNGLTGALLGNQFVAHRDSAAHEWRATDITPQAAGHEEAEAGTEYQGFADDLSRGVIGVITEHFASLSQPNGPAACNALYVSPFDGSYRPLFTESESPGFCGRLPMAGKSPQNLVFAGGNRGTPTTSAYTELLFQTPAALTPTAEPSVAEGEGDNLYVSANSKPYLASVLPNGQPDADAVFGSPPVAQTHHFASKNHHFGASNVISDDGSLVFWTDLSTHRLYMRENPTAPESPHGGAGECLIASDACTVAISNGEATYWTATPDGHYVLYTEAEQLWRYNTILGAREALLQTDEHGAPAGVQGVVGASEDGSYVYVVAQGALAPGSEERKCAEPISETSATAEERERHEAEQKAEGEGLLPTGRGCNLYLLHVGHEPSFIAALGAIDNALTLSLESIDNRLGAWQPDMGVRTSQVTPNGLSLVFGSTQRLLGYDTTNLVNNGAAPQKGLEIFVYNADSSGGTLSCASCEPRGQALPPEAITDLAPTFNSTYAHRWISDDGHHVFFNTGASLVPEDTNGRMDVYEWENQGPSCPTPTSTYGGCVFLLSGGNTTSPSYFVDASASGDDVFFTHRGQLGQVGSPSTSNSVLFDARVAGGFESVAAGCGAGLCSGNAPGPGGLATPPPTSAITGNGNVAPRQPGPSKPLTAAQIRALRLRQALNACRTKRNRHKRTVCVIHARKRYGPPHKAKTHKGGK